jgi:hypothetical protein
VSSLRSRQLLVGLVGALLQRATQWREAAPMKRIHAVANQQIAPPRQTDECEQRLHRRRPIEQRRVRVLATTCSISMRRSAASSNAHVRARANASTVVTSGAALAQQGRRAPRASSRWSPPAACVAAA